MHKNTDVYSFLINYVCELEGIEVPNKKKGDRQIKKQPGG